MDKLSTMVAFSIINGTFTHMFDNQTLTWTCNVNATYAYQTILTTTLAAASITFVCIHLIDPSYPILFNKNTIVLTLSWHIRTDLIDLTTLQEYITKIGQLSARTTKQGYICLQWCNYWWLICTELGLSDLNLNRSLFHTFNKKVMITIVLYMFIQVSIDANLFVILQHMYCACHFSLHLFRSQVIYFK